MKILLINKFISQTGGSEKYTYELGNVLEQNNHEVSYFALSRRPFFRENIAYTELFPEYENYSDIYKKKFSIKKISKLFYNFEAEKKLDILIKKIQPDIVHINCIDHYLTPSVIKACKKNKLPMVLTIHDPGFACPNGSLMDKNNRFCKGKYCVKGNFTNCITRRCRKNNFVYSAFLTAIFVFYKILRPFRNIKKFICPSKAIYDLAVEHGICKEKITVVNNFVSRNLIDAEPSFENKGYFLFVGRIIKEKGLQYLLQAMEELPEIKLRIVGNGSDEEYFKQIANDKGLANVEFVGHKTGCELENEYKNSIATIIPSCYFEAFGLTILESFAYGKPVIGSNIGGIPQIIENNLTGIIVEPENSEMLKNAIKELYYNQEKTINMGKSAKDKVKNYSAERFYSQIIEIYNLALSKG